MKNIGLIKGRHEMPVETYVFDEVLDPTDVEGLQNIAFDFLKKDENQEINIYVTGLTVCLVAVINVARQLNIKLNLYHFNIKNREYFKQTVN